MNKKNSKINILFRFIKTSLGFFVLTIVSSFLVTIFDAVIPQIVRFTVDSLIGNEDPNAYMYYFQRLFGGSDYLRSNLWIIAIAIAVTAVFASFFKYCTRVSNAKGSECMAENMRNMLYKHIQSLPYSWHISNQTGDIIQRCTSDVDTVRNFVSEQLVDVFRLVFIIAFSWYMMFSMNITLSLIALMFIPIILAYTLIFFKKIGKHFIEADECEGQLSAVAQENLTGVRVVRAFGREIFERNKFSAKNEEYAGLWVKLGGTMGWFWGIGDFISGLLIAAIVCVGTVFTVKGRITVGEFIAYVSYTGMLVWPVRRLGRIMADLSKANVSLDRLGYILNSESESDADDAVEPDLNGDIVFKNVSFSYLENKPVLKNLSFTIKAGTTFGILGGTGSGKSTMVHLLDKMYDLEPGNGTITINGIDVKNIKSDWLRKNVGMILQEPFLFSRTIGENIGITDSELSNDDIKNAAQIACVDKDICEFKNAYDTIVGERGVTLSGGQKQRVAIARTLTIDPPIIVFDDSLSAVDTETDTNIRKALKGTTNNKTVILISHRIVSLMEADLILVLKDGELSQLGTHDELIKEDGIYKEIYELQSSVTGGSENE